MLAASLSEVVMQSGTGTALLALTCLLLYVGNSRVTAADQGDAISCALGCALIGDTRDACVLACVEEDETISPSLTDGLTHDAYCLHMCSTIGSVFSEEKSRRFDRNSCSSKCKSLLPFPPATPADLVGGIDKVISNLPIEDLVSFQ